MSDGQIEYLEWSDDAPHPLGRHVRHDPRSRGFAAPRRAEPTRDKRHRLYGGVLDQDGIGACTGFAGVAALNAAPLRSTFRPAGPFENQDGFNLYSAASARDVWDGTWPPTDTGSSGLAVASVLVDIGHIEGYDWAFGFQHGLEVIPTRPLMQGTWWTEDMFHPDADGRVRPTGADAGGHEYLWVGIELRSKTTRADNRSWFVNSWTPDWGKDGYFYMTWDDHAALLERDGDLIALR